MDVSLEHTFRRIPGSDAAEALVREEEEKLLTLTHEILRCRVVVEKPHRRHVKGNLYRVLVVLSLPGHELCVSHGPEARRGDEYMAAAIRQAFHAARIQTKKLLARTRKPPHPALHEFNGFNGDGNSSSPPMAEENLDPCERYQESASGELPGVI